MQICLKRAYKTVKTYSENFVSPINDVVQAKQIPGVMANFDPGGTFFAAGATFLLEALLGMDATLAVFGMEATLAPLGRSSGDFGFAVGGPIMILGPPSGGMAHFAPSVLKNVMNYIKKRLDFEKNRK